MFQDSPQITQIHRFKWTARYILKLESLIALIWSWFIALCSLNSFLICVICGSYFSAFEVT